MGAAYTFKDDAVRMGSTYYYRLEAVDVYGHSAFHGPVSATVQPLRRIIVRPRLKPGVSQK
jgi:hypothetical protein